MNKKFLVSLVLSTSVVAGCSTTTNVNISGVDRKQFLIYGSQEFADTTHKQYRDMMNTYKSKGVLDNNPELSKRVFQIAKRIIPQAQEMKPEIKNWSWEIHTINTNELNAFCAGQGKLGVYQGIVTRLQLTDDEIAAVIGHEVAHGILEHGRERASREIVTNIVLSKFDGNGQLLAHYAQKLGLSLPFNRSQETEADILGVRLAAKAGYDPRAAVSFWQKMALTDKNSNSKLMAMISTHPMPEKRMLRLQDEISVVMPMYMASKVENKK